MAGKRRTHANFDRWQLGAGGLVALLAIGVALTIQSTRRLSEDAESVSHTHEVMDTLTEVHAHLREAEATQRSYLITGGEAIPSDFSENVAAAEQKVRSLEILTRDNDQQQTRIPNIHKQIEQLAELWTRAMTVRAEEGFDAAKQVVATNQSRKMMSELEGGLQRMGAMEDLLLRSRLEQRENSYRLSLIIGLLSGLMAIAGVLAFVALFRRHLAERTTASTIFSEQGERLRTTLASIGDAVITTDTQGRVTGMNAVAETLTGWTLSEASGQLLDAVFRIVNEDTRQPVESPATRALADGKIVGLANHTVLIAKDGRERPIDDSAAPIRCSEGQIVGCVLVFRDITERRALEKENSRRLADARLLASIVDSSNDAIVSKTLDGVIRSWNGAAARLFGYTAEQAVGRHISLIIPPERIAEEEEIVARLQAGQRIEHYETERIRSDGHTVAVALTISPLHDDSGQVVGASKIARDITARKQVEQRERQLLAEAAAANSKFRAFFDQSSLFAGIMDVEGTILEANQLSWEGCGYTRDQIIGKPFWEGPWWTPLPRLVEQIKLGSAQAAAGQTFREEMTYFVADGSERVVDVSITPVMDESGRVLFLAPIGTDITDRKRAEAAVRESEVRFRTLADNMSQFAWMANESGWIFWYNKRWFDYTGTTLEEMQGWGWKGVHHPDHVDRVVARIQKCWDTGEEWEDTFPLRGQDGNYRWFLSRATPIRDEHGKILRWFGTNTDITEVRQLEENLRKLAADLSEADRRKDEFLATLSHELRNPLAAIYGASELLNLVAQSDPTLQETVEIVYGQAQHMVRLIDDLMDVNRITSGRLNLRKERVNLADIVERAVDSSRPLIDRAQHRLIVSLPEEPLRLDADPVRLAQVFANLLNNAAKYSEDGGQIWLSAVCEGREVVVSVKDTGIGIEPDQLPQLFEMFSQVHSALDRSQGGLGIGLALVRGLVEMHEGSVEARSEGSGQGSEFIVRLPLVDFESLATKPSSQGEQALNHSPCRIMVADDNRGIVLTLASLLRTKGHEVRIAHDGVEALAISGSFKPHLALLDIGMPGMNGYEVARRIREQPWGNNILLVAMTGWGQDEDKRQARVAGFDHHMTKPVSAADLDPLLEQLAVGRSA